MYLGGVARRWLGAASAILGGTIALGCSPTTSSASSPGALPVTVTSVAATLTEYNPQYASAGIPAEEVAFTVGASPSGSFACTVEVWRSGKMVGSTQVTASSPNNKNAPAKESWPVTITGETFAGKPSDANVTCHVIPSRPIPPTTLGSS